MMQRKEVFYAVIGGIVGAILTITRVRFRHLKRKTK